MCTWNSVSLAGAIRAGTADRPSRSLPRRVYIECGGLEGGNWRRGHDFSVVIRRSVDLSAGISTLQGLLVKVH